MAELIKCETVSLPALVAVGKPLRVTVGEVRENNPIPAFWEQCFESGLFETLDETPCWNPDFVGFETNMDEAAGTWDYVVGMLKEPGAVIPNGCAAYPIAPTEALLLWVKGTDTADAAGAAHPMALAAAAEKGLTPGDWSMELYNCPRFTVPDADGHITLDYYLPIVR